MSIFNDELVLARSLAASGQVHEAALRYEGALQNAEYPEALDFLSIYALRNQQPARAATYFERLLKHLGSPDPQTLENLAVAYEQMGLLNEARSTLLKVLQAQPAFYVALLYLGRIEQTQGNQQTAEQLFRKAINLAQAQGQWLNPETTPPWLIEPVMHAVTGVNTYQCQQLGAALGALRTEHGNHSLSRIETFIRSYTGLERRVPMDSQQRPKRHYIPDLPAMPWIDRDLLPWADQLEAATEVIREELLVLLAAEVSFEPFLKFHSQEQISNYLGSAGATPHWDAFFFYRHGQRHEENCRRCPRTAEILDALPIIRLPGVSPEICFSMLTPGTRILPHHGDSNARIVVHLPLVVPAGCALQVAGEAREWLPGKVMAFDDTYEHEAWNNSDSTRIVLIIDIWNPHLSEVERLGFAAVVDAIREHYSNGEEPPAAVDA